MSIAQNPHRMKAAADEKRAAGFIRAAAKKQDDQAQTEAKTITLRFDAGILDRAGRAAKRLGISRNAFFSLAAVAKLEDMQI